MFIYVFSGARTLFLTKKIYSLYKVDVSANTIDIHVFRMIYNTAAGICKRRQLYQPQSSHISDFGAGMSPSAISRNAV